jgi:hypothetical protein
MTKIRIETVGFGDTVQLDGHTYIVNSISEPDSHGTYDLYLLDKAGVQHHKVICEGVDLFYGE